MDPGYLSMNRWMSLLLTDNASPGSSDRMMPGFLVEEGRGMEKLVIAAISLNLLLRVCWMDGPETVMTVLFTC